jgi:hypothetical protein
MSGNINGTGRMPCRIPDELSEDHFRAMAFRSLHAEVLQELDEAAPSRNCLAATDRLKMPLHNPEPRKKYPLARGRWAANIALFP